jgi:hypothetical protein
MGRRVWGRKGFGDGGRVADDDHDGDGIFDQLLIEPPSARQVILIRESRSPENQEPLPRANMDPDESL